MPDACRDYFRALNKSSGKVLSESFKGARAAQMARSHAYAKDIALWVKELESRPESPVLRAALREYQFALLALCQGQYRASFGALRLFLEQCLATVDWSANERQLREWLRGERDANWKALTSEESGVLSRSFVRLFFETLADSASRYRASALSVYRECSEYVHGNAETNRSLPETVVFDLKAYEAWHQKASVIRLVTSFALVVRYLQNLALPARVRLEHTVLDNLGHEAAVRALFAAAVEAPDV
jgi:hypothetical protein